MLTRQRRSLRGHPAQALRLPARRVEGRVHPTKPFELGPGQSKTIGPALGAICLIVATSQATLSHEDITVVVRSGC